MSADPLLNVYAKVAAPISRDPDLARFITDPAHPDLQPNATECDKLQPNATKCNLDATSVAQAEYTRNSHSNKYLIFGNPAKMQPNATEVLSRSRCPQPTQQDCPAPPPLLPLSPP